MTDPFRSGIVPTTDNRKGTSDPREGEGRHIFDSDIPAELSLWLVQDRPAPNATESMMAEARLIRTYPFLLWVIFSERPNGRS
jgi:hypothetical protein